MAHAKGRFYFLDEGIKLFGYIARLVEYGYLEILYVGKSKDDPVNETAITPEILNEMCLYNTWSNEAYKIMTIKMLRSDEDDFDIYRFVNEFKQYIEKLELIDN